MLYDKFPNKKRYKIQQRCVIMSTTCEVTVTHKTKQNTSMSTIMSTMPIYSTMNKKSSKKMMHASKKYLVRAMTRK